MTSGKIEKEKYTHNDKSKRYSTKVQMFFFYIDDDTRLKYY